MLDRKYTLVLIDDALDSLLLFERIVNVNYPEIFDIHKFPGGVEAMEFILAKHVDVVVCDLHMPQISGNDVLQRCKGLHRGILFYVMTGDSNASAAVSSFFDGADGYIMKPITQDGVRGGMGQCIQTLEHWAQIFQKVFTKTLAS